MSAKITDYITRDRPVGPIDSTWIHDTQCMQALFSQYNEIFRRLMLSPSIIVGRRGSGKTSYLHSVYFSRQYDIIVELSTQDAFSNVIEAIEGMTRGAVFTESVAEIWATVLRIGILSQLRTHVRDVDQRRTIDEYLEWIEIGRQATVNDALMTVARLLRKYSATNSMSTALERLRRPGGVTYDDAEKVVLRFLDWNGYKVVLLLDSLDDFRLEFDSVTDALAGMLKCLGEFNQPGGLGDVRFCLPAELYRKFLEISTNPNKDFSRRITLHWIASELLVMGAQRLHLYLTYYEPDTLERIGKLDLSRRQNAVRLLEAVLPDEVVGPSGIAEPSLSYILRHTQLLPRHFLILLNAIFSRHARNGHGPFAASEQSVVDGIMQREEQLVYEILRAYRPVYPLAAVVCQRCLPELSTKFRLGDLQRVFRSFGKVALQSDEFFEFRDLLLAIGAVGRVTEETDLYVKGKFAYTESRPLNLSSDDAMCIHPLFSDVFSARTDGCKPVYPYGSDVEDPDNRDLIAF